MLRQSIAAAGVWLSSIIHGSEKTLALFASINWVYNPVFGSVQVLAVLWVIIENRHALTPEITIKLQSLNNSGVTTFPQILSVGFQD